MIIYVSEKVYDRLTAIGGNAAIALLESKLETYNRDEDDRYLSDKKSSSNWKAYPLPIQEDSELYTSIATIAESACIRVNLVAGYILSTCVNDRGLERYYQFDLQRKLGGTRELTVASGRIDLITSTHIYEVKIAKDWKHAIGQVLVYCTHFPDRQPVIALFGKVSHTLVRTIDKACDIIGVEVLWL